MPHVNLVKQRPFLNWSKNLTQTEHTTVLYVNIEPAQAKRGDVERAMKIIIKEFLDFGKLFLSKKDENVHSSPALKDENVHSSPALKGAGYSGLLNKKEQKIVIELKLWHGPKALADGLSQTAEYMDTNNATEGHLVIFDRKSDKSWEEKIYQQEEEVDGKTVCVWGM
jgi:hypothetical protein